MYNLPDNICLSKVMSAEGFGFNYIVPIDYRNHYNCVLCYAQLGTAKQLSTIFKQLAEMLEHPPLTPEV